MAKVSSREILQTIENIELNNAKYTEQDHSKASYANKLLKSESCINWIQLIHDSLFNNLFA